MKKIGKLVGVCNCICHCGLEDCFTEHDKSCEHCSKEQPKPLDRLLDTKKLSDSKPECTCSDNGMTKTVRSDCPIHQAMLQINAVQDPKPKPDETIVIRGKATLDGIGTFDNSKPECECCTCHKDKICYHPCCRNKPECTCHINHYGKIGIGIENVPSCPVHGIEQHECICPCHNPEVEQLWSFCRDKCRECGEHYILDHLQEDWEEKFDNEFEIVHMNNGLNLLAVGMDDADKIKSFIRELLQKEKAYIGKGKREWYERGFKDAEADKKLVTVVTDGLDELLKKTKELNEALKHRS